MATISPTLTLASNASTHASTPGPLSIALSLSATSSLTVDNVRSKTLVFADNADHQLVFVGSTLDSATVGGINGGFIYFKNASITDLDIYIGIVAAGGGAVALETDGNAARLLTLRKDEFAWIPYDYTMDITADASGAATLEYWLFNRNNA